MGIIKEDLIFGRIAVLNNIISEEQFQEACEHQKRLEIPKPLGLILLNKGYINRLQFKAILDAQKKKLPRPAITLQERREDIAFAYFTVKHNYLDVETIYECLQIQSELVKKGLLFRLSELLINQGYLSVSETDTIVQLQNSHIVECPECKTRYNTVGLGGNSQFPCKKCPATVTIPPDLGSEEDVVEIEQFRLALEATADRKRLEKPPTLPRMAQAVASSRTIMASASDRITENIPALPLSDESKDGEEYEQLASSQTTTPDLGNQSDKGYIDLESEEAVVEQQGDGEAENCVDLEAEEFIPEPQPTDEEYISPNTSQQPAPGVSESYMSIDGSPQPYKAPDHGISLNAQATMEAKPKDSEEYWSLDAPILPIEKQQQKPSL